MGKVCLIVLILLVVAAAALYVSCRVLFRTGTEVKFHFGEPHKKPSSTTNPIVMAMRAKQDAAAKWLEKQPFQTVHILSRDGLRLAGHWLPCEAAQRTVLLCHGWKGNWAKEMGIFGPFLQAQNCNLLFIEQRGHGKSEGKYLGFGVLERYDCQSWIQYLQEHTASELPIYLFGCSLGATAVLMASGFHLPKQVQGIVADCGFVSPEEQITATLKAWWHLPKEPFLSIADRICRRKAGYSYREYSTLQAMEHNTKPILFVHGMEDRFVLPENTLKVHRACRTEKELLLVEGARHIQSYLMATEAYQRRLTAFFAKYDRQEEMA